MLSAPLVLLAAAGTLAALVAVARYGDRAGLLTGRSRPLIYALTLGVYCTSWTFLGSVGVASRSGLDFLAIYLGPVLVFGLGAPLLARVVRLAKAQNSTSVADFVAALHGKSGALAAAVTLACVVAALPYVALQLKAITASLGAVLGGASALGGFDPGLLVALGLGAFAAAFGARRVDATAHQGGLMLAVALESAVKLAAFLGVGATVVWGMHDGPADLAAKVMARPELAARLTGSPDWANFAAMTLASALAVVLLPRQFHVAVVENRRPRDLARARWLFPLYLVLINLFVLPIAAAGLLAFPEGTVDRDLTVIALPLAGGHAGAALLALFGTLSAATAMVIVECVALAVMVSNHIALPFVLARRRQAPGAEGAGDVGGRGGAGPGDATLGDADLGALVLGVRRGAILLVLLLAWGYGRVGGEAALASIGLLSFAAIAQVGPAFLAGLVPGEPRPRAAVAGLVLGLAAWAYAMLLPSLALGHPLLEALVRDGPFGLQGLRPARLLNDLLGTDWPPFLHGMVVSLGLNAGAMGLALALASPRSRGRRPRRAGVSAGEVAGALARYLGAERVGRAFEAFAQERGLAFDPARPADAALLRFAERQLAAAIGAASARLVLTGLLRRRQLSRADALRLLDDASAALRQDRDLLQHALDHADQGVIVLDRAQRLVAHNRAFGEIFGLPAHLLRAGTPLDAIFADNARRGVYGEIPVGEAVAARLERFEAADGPQRLVMSHPFSRVVEWRVTHLPDGGTLATYTDVTEAAAAEAALEERVRARTEEITRVNAALEAARAAAEEADRSKTRFLAAASHDLLQPLNAARLYAAALTERREAHGGPGHDPEAARHLDQSLEAVEDILEALLEISRLDSGTQRLNLTVFRLDELFRQLRVEFEPVARAKGLALDFAPTSLAVRSDRRLLRRMMQNLVSNAVKYTPRGRVLVGCRRVGAGGTGAGVRLEVHDTGLGIPAGQQRAVFREFRRLDAGQRAAPGLGLGLSIVERSARALGHAVTLRSLPGRGSTFALVAPRAPAPARPLPAPAGGGRGAGAAGAPLRGVVVLAVDNEPAILEGMRALLAAWGCEVLLARDLDGARLAAAARGPDAVVADYHLDDGDGLALLAALRAELPGAFRAVLVTADRSAELRDAAAAAEVELLPKPVKPAALRAALAQWRAARAAAE